MHSEEYAELAKITIWGNKAEYVARWDYDLQVDTKPRPEYDVPTGHSGGLSWNRIATLLHLAKSGLYDWLYAVGCDTLITNLTIPLESFIIETPWAHFIIAVDCYHFNADSFLVRCSPEGIAFLEAILARFEEYKLHPWVEQEVMIQLLPEFRRIISILPQRRLNSYDYSLYSEPIHKLATDCLGHSGQWQPGDFLIHWPSQTVPKRLELCQKYLPLIVK